MTFYSGVQSWKVPLKATSLCGDTWFSTHQAANYNFIQGCFLPSPSNMSISGIVVKETSSFPLSFFPFGISRNWPCSKELHTLCTSLFFFGGYVPEHHRKNESHMLEYPSPWKSSKAFGLNLMARMCRFLSSFPLVVWSWHAELPKHHIALHFVGSAGKQ